jgi:hypothetical protein
LGAAGQAVTVDDDRSSVLVVRVWLEHGPDGFRARLTTVGPRRGLEPGNDVAVALAASPAAVSDAVRAWLLSFVSPRPGPAESPGQGGHDVGVTAG